MSNLFQTKRSAPAETYICVVHFENGDKSRLFKSYHKVSSKYLNRVGYVATEEELDSIFKRSIEILNFVLSESCTNQNVSIQDDNKFFFVMKKNRNNELYKYKKNPLRFKEEFELGDSMVEKIKENIYNDYETAVKYATIGFIQSNLN